MQKSILWPTFIYGLLIIGFGAYGYWHAASKVSLGMGVGLGGFLLVSCLLLLAEKKLGAYLALCLTALLSASFVYRYLATQGSLPAISAVVSGAMLLYLLARIAKWKR